MFSPLHLGFYCGFSLMFFDVSLHFQKFYVGWKVGTTNDLQSNPVYDFLLMTMNAGSERFGLISNLTKFQDHTFAFLAMIFAILFLVVISIGFTNYVLVISLDNIQVTKI